MNTLKRLFTLIQAYYQSKYDKHWQFANRIELERHQQKQLDKFIKHTLSKSPYFRSFIDKPFKEWGYMDKSVMMGEFDRINTVGINKKEAWDKAQKAETGDIESAVISTQAGDISVGLSSGTSGQRGMFLVSEAEQARWAGIMLAKMLPKGLLAREKVALLLRANSNLYQAVKTPLLSFQFFDLFSPIDSWLNKLADYQPTTLVAPAQVLVHIARQVNQGKLILSPSQVISGAEVLSEQDKALLQKTFPNARINEVYQATEGFLACSCSQGHLHLNEAHLIIEKEWLVEKCVADDYLDQAEQTVEQTKEKRRFIPIITDFSRHTQPIVRYRLNDILHIDPDYMDTTCPCGDVSTVIKRIEGRTGDTLSLPSLDHINDHEYKGKNISVFADVIERAISQSLTGEDGKWTELDYELVQTQENQPSTQLTPNTHLMLSIDCQHLDQQEQQTVLTNTQQHLEQTLTNLGVDINKITWQIKNSLPPIDFTQKKRRVKNSTTYRELIDF